MKKVYIWCFFSIFLNIALLNYPQIQEIKHLPVSNHYQFIKESAPAWVSENEILIFYNLNHVGLASGVYIYQTKVNDPESSSGQVFITSKKMVLIK